MPDWLNFTILWWVFLIACYFIERAIAGDLSPKGLGWAIPLALVTFFLLTVPILILNGLLALLNVNPYYEEIWDILPWIAGVITLLVFLFFWAYGQTKTYDDDMDYLRQNIHK